MSQAIIGPSIRFAVACAVAVLAAILGGLLARSIGAHTVAGDWPWTGQPKPVHTATVARADGDWPWHTGLRNVDEKAVGSSTGRSVSGDWPW